MSSIGGLSSLKKITYDKFQTKIIKTITSKEEYLKYVENNILFYNRDIIATLI